MDLRRIFLRRKNFSKTNLYDDEDSSGDESEEEKKQNYFVNNNTSNNNKNNIINDNSNFHQKYSLFSVGLNSFLVEWDLLNLHPKQYYSCNGHSIWDANFSIENRHTIYLACNDGVVRAINTKSTFYLEKQFQKVDSPVTSIAFNFNKSKNQKNKTGGKKQDNEEIVCTGHLDGKINKWSNGVIVSTFGNNAYTYNKNKSKKQNKMEEELSENSDNIEDTPKPTNTIWKLVFINKKYLASGNEFGELQIWNVKFGVLYRRFKEHDGDILDICFNSNNNYLYFTGVDSVIISLHFTGKDNNNVEEDFKMHSKLRPQSHDINSIVFIEKDNLLISGGVTTDICLIRLDKGRFLESFGKSVLSNNSKLNYLILIIKYFNFNFIFIFLFTFT
jgi:hypothetical protein